MIARRAGLQRRAPLHTTTGLHRGAGLARTGGLTRTGGVSNGVGLARSSELHRGVPMVTKPAPQSKAERTARKLVSVRSGGVCEVDGRRPATDWHHRRNRTQGGRWAAGNGLHACRQCHAWITAHPLAAARYGWAIPGWPPVPPETVPALLRPPGMGPRWVLLENNGGHQVVAPPTTKPDTEEQR